MTARDVAKNRERGNQAKILYDFKGERVQGQVARRVRNAQQRLDALERDQVRKPPPPCASRRRAGTGVAPGGGDVVAWARGVVVHRPGRGGPGAAPGERPDRLDMAASGVPSVEVARGAGSSSPGPTAPGSPRCCTCSRATSCPTPAPWAGRAGPVGLLEQDVHLHDDDRTPRELLALAQGVDPADARDAAVDAHGLLAPRDLGRRLAELSVGQRRRVVLAMLVTQAPDVLLLDEPTNHVSLTLAGELMEAVAEWPGAVVVASHDRWLRRRWQGDAVHLD